MTYNEVIDFLESLVIMPKTAPGLDKIKKAVAEKNWFYSLANKNIITVAGTNGKGTTCAALESLLLNEKKSTALYTSPHLVSTTERIRYNGVSISETHLVEVFINNKDLILKHDLSHFESLTLMAADYFFSEKWMPIPDYTLLEVGLGGLFDATNVFPNKYSVITQLGIDHENILGNTLLEISKNKVGIVKKGNKVIYQKLPVSLSLDDLKSNVNYSDVEWIEVAAFFPLGINSAETKWGIFQTNMLGQRALDNVVLALTVFEQLGFDSAKNLQALKNINWQGRMSLCPGIQKRFPLIQSDVYLSGDHNEQGVESLIRIIQQLKYNNLHLVVGVGKDKDYPAMLERLLQLKNVQLYITETPFKGLAIEEYGPFLAKATFADKDIFKVFEKIKASKEDLTVVTGSLYLIGLVLKKS